MRFFGFLILILIVGKGFAQCPSADFSLLSNGCINQNLLIQNSSTSGLTCEWDFCSGDFLSDPVATPVLGNSSLSQAWSLRIIKDHGNWYGFAISVTLNTLMRFNFGSSLNNTPTFTDLGNPANLLSGATDFQMVQENSIWYALVSNTNTSHLLRLNFVNGLQSPPTAVDLGSLGSTLNSPNGIFVVDDAGSKTVFITNGGAAEIVRADFGNSIFNSPTTSVQSVPGGSGLRGISITRECSRWYGLVLSYGNGQVYSLDFTNGLAQPFTSAQVTFYSSYNFPASITVLNEGAQYYAFIQSALGNVYRLSYGSSIIDGTGTGTDLGNLGTSTSNFAQTWVSDNSDWFGFSIDRANSQLVLLKSPSQCDSNFPVLTTFNPPIIKYSNAGAKKVTLKAYDSQGIVTYVSHNITIASSVAPDIQFTSQNSCALNAVNFNSSNQSNNITNYAWDFGDGASDLVNANPSHIYSTASIFYPSLTVTASNSCQNFTKDTLQIFNAPQANFSLPVASPLCTNQNYLFANTTTVDPGSNPTWQWSVNGSNTSTAQNLTYLFTSSTSQSIVLTASIPGCSTQSSQSITTLVDGPLISFSSASGACKGSTVAFTNTTTDQVTSFSWSYGDGNSSSQVNGSNAFSSSGNFVVNLSGVNSNGCQNSYSKNITIYSLPQPDFAIEAPPLSCEKTPSQFDNLTPPLVDSNISSWVWKFGDNGTSTVKNPTHTYATANNYMVSLIATTNVGCKDSTQISIHILPSPQAGFTNTAACVNQSTHFVDASSGSISSYQWNVQNTVLSGSTPSYVFRSSGIFPVTLTVTGSNGCLNQSVKNIQVPVLPLVDFLVQAPCTGHPTTFQELNSGGSDPAIAWNWDFDGNSATGSPANYQFPSEGIHSVTMSSTRQSGCIYSTQKNISISAGPIASFTPSVIAGPAPLDVTFNNTSTADSYFWQFGGQDPATSSDVSPEFIYTELGKYIVVLTAFNNLGCFDTLSTEIDVVIPRIDIVMNNFSLTNDPNTNSSKAVVTILNSGNIPLVDPEVLIDFGGSASVKEKIPGLVRPGKSIMQTLGLQIVPRSLEYICAEINVTDDVDIHNNKQCVPLSDEDVVLAPYPNPATAGEVTLEWVAAAQEDVVITIFKSTGEIAFEKHLDKNSAGLGQLTVNTSSFGNGLYLIQFAGSKTTKTFRIMIAN